MSDGHVPALSTMKRAPWAKVRLVSSCESPDMVFEFAGFQWGSVSFSTKKRASTCWSVMRGWEAGTQDRSRL